MYRCYVNVRPFFSQKTHKSQTKPTKYAKNTRKTQTNRLIPYLFSQKNRQIANKTNKIHKKHRENPNTSSNSIFFLAKHTHKSQTKPRKYAKNTGKTKKTRIIPSFFSQNTIKHNKQTIKYTKNRESQNNPKNNTEQSCTLEEPDTFSVLCFLCYGSCSVAKTIKPKN